MLENRASILRGGDTVKVPDVLGGATPPSANDRNGAAHPGDVLMDTMPKLWVGPAPVSQDIERDSLQGSC